VKVLWEPEIFFGFCIWKKYYGRKTDRISATGHYGWVNNLQDHRGQ